MKAISGRLTGQLYRFLIFFGVNRYIQVAVPLGVIGVSENYFKAPFSNAPIAKLHASMAEPNLSHISS